MVCRGRLYEVTSLNQIGSDFIFVDSSKPELSLVTNDDVNIGIHTIQLTVTLEHYSHITETEEFLVEITSCIVNKFSADSNIVSDDD